MNKVILLLLCSQFSVYSQKSVETFGYRHFQIYFETDTVEVLVRSKLGEEQVKKPLFFSVQGSSAVPLIVHDGKRKIRSVSLSEGFVEEDFHLIMVSKPGIPLICHKDSLSKRGVYKDQVTNEFPTQYLKNNNLEYYVERNSVVLDFLKHQDWVDTSQIIVAGHSEGSTIAAHMANKIDGVTHLIYSGGGPYYSRILSMIQQERRLESNEENPWISRTFDYWEDVIKYPYSMTRNKGWNTNRGTYSFSKNENEVLKNLNIPILISFGTEDEACPSIDMFHIEVIKERIPNISFNSYVGLNHNYSVENPDSNAFKKVDYVENVVRDWLLWINKN